MTYPARVEGHEQMNGDQECPRWKPKNSVRGLLLAGTSFWVILAWLAW